MSSKLERVVIFFGVILLVAGCSDRMPEVNKENCKIQNINKIKDEATRASFSEKCFHSGEVVSSPARHKSY